VMTSRMRRFGITFFSFGFYFAKDFLRWFCQLIFRREALGFLIVCVESSCSLIMFSHKWVFFTSLAYFVVMRLSTCCWRIPVRSQVLMSMPKIRFATQIANHLSFRGSVFRSWHFPRRTFTRVYLSNYYRSGVHHSCMPAISLRTIVSMCCWETLAPISTFKTRLVSPFCANSHLKHCFRIRSLVWLSRKAWVSPCNFVRLEMKRRWGRSQVLDWTCFWSMRSDRIKYLLGTFWKKF
jgi:hypothetical protein